MVAYGRARAAALGVPLDYQLGDMCGFASPPRYDLAAILMDSASYLFTNDAVLQHLRAAAAALRPGGLYVLEMAHPRDLFGVGRSVTTRWEAARGAKRVRVEWGHEDDAFDPVTQINQTSVVLECWDGADHEVLRETAPQRYFTATEWDALVRAAGCFDVVATLGAMDRAVPFDNAKRAWRMVSVLQTRAGT
jgi:hypothetical protein